jgi:hypothetical protein
MGRFFVSAGDDELDILMETEEYLGMDGDNLIADGNKMVEKINIQKVVDNYER